MTRNPSLPARRPPQTRIWLLVRFASTLFLCYKKCEFGTDLAEKKPPFRYTNRLSGMNQCCRKRIAKFDPFKREPSKSTPRLLTFRALLPLLLLSGGSVASYPSVRACMLCVKASYSCCWKDTYVRSNSPTHLSLIHI